MAALLSIKNESYLALEICSDMAQVLLPFLAHQSCSLSSEKVWCYAQCRQLIGNVTFATIGQTHSDNFCKQPIADELVSRTNHKAWHLNGCDCTTWRHIACSNLSLWFTCVAFWPPYAMRLRIQSAALQKRLHAWHGLCLRFDRFAVYVLCVIIMLTCSTSLRTLFVKIPVDRQCFELTISTSNLHFSWREQSFI